MKSVCVSTALLLIIGAASANAADEVDFSRDVRPILSANCFACHGPDDKARQAGLRLDTQEGAYADHDGSRAVVPGKPEASSLIERILSKDPDLVMPPPKTGHKLTETQRETLARWIKAGAKYDQHWSFKPLVRPAVPAAKLPASNGKPPVAPIDAFIQTRLDAAGLKPAGEAQPQTLLRRISLDLTGLPPSPAEQDAFFADKSDAAYEKVVDRLLASPRFGEHWARMWLDLARYADTKGYEKDQPRQIWRYRDWVIDAFNSDMPFDQFTLEQLAGDLLPNATEQQILATAFHRNTMTNDEGGTDDEEFRAAAVKDRINTTIQVWMGLTMGCANCHTHKYDPISQADYYRFYALFNQTEDNDRSDDSPTLAIPTTAQKEQIAAIELKLKQQRDEFWKPLTEEQTAKQRAWETSLASQHVWQSFKPESAKSDQDATLTVQPDGAVLASGKHPDTDVYTLVLTSTLKKITAIRLDALTHASLPQQGPGRHRDDNNFVVSELTVLREGSETPLKLTNARADFSQGGWEVAKAIDGNGETGWAVSPEKSKPHVAIFDLAEPLTAADGESIKLTVRMTQNYPKLQLGHFRISATDADPKTLRPELQTLSQIAATPLDKRSAEQQRKLDEAYRAQDAAFAPLQKAVAATEAELKAVQQQVPKTPIFRELAQGKRRATRIHQRGNFLELGDTVEPAVLAAFGTLPEDASQNRVGVARWLTSSGNPLTARVMANRLWSRLFGNGLVETEEDFGAQGSVPTHPELLDWLATEFRDTHHWSIKKTLKTIVMSAAYRRSSETSGPDQDRHAALYATGPRFRLSAEVIRDQALAVSGLLSAKMYGPSVMPPQPAGLWKAAYSSLKWETSPGEDRYRRGLYTFTRRTSPYPSMTTFDAGSGEVCVIRRIRTNTPLAALVTLNDPAFFEAAGAFGQRVLQEGGATNQDRIKHAYRLLLSRQPVDAEIARCEAVLKDLTAEYAADEASAKKVLESCNLAVSKECPLAEQAAWAVFGNILFNLDETVTKP